MYDKDMREPTRTEEMMVVTFREVIEGTIYHNQNVRLSDALNAEAHHHSRYVALKDATVYSIATRRQILKSAFLLVSHHQVIYMTPKSAVMGAENVSDTVGAARGDPGERPAVPVSPDGHEMIHPDLVTSSDPAHRIHAHSYHELLDMLTEIRTHGPGKTTTMS